MRTYASSRVKRRSFYRRSKLQMFWLIFGGQYGVPIQSSTKVRETFRKITQKLWATKTWDLDKLFKNQSLIRFHFLGFFYWTVSNLFFCCVTMKTIYRHSPFYTSLPWVPEDFFLIDNDAASPRTISVHKKKISSRTQGNTSWAISTEPFKGFN